MSASEIVIAVTYPRWMEVRPEAETRHDLELVAEMDPPVRVVRDEYEDSEELRTRRGTPPFDGLAGAAGADPRAGARLGEAEIILGLDLPFELLDAGSEPAVGPVHGRRRRAADLVRAAHRPGPAHDGERQQLGVDLGVRDRPPPRDLEALPDLDAKQQARDWSGTYGREASRRTLGLVGLGAINAHVARRAQAFDMTVLATRRSYTPWAPGSHVDELFAPDRSHEMLGAVRRGVLGGPGNPRDGAHVRCGRIRRDEARVGVHQRGPRDGCRRERTRRHVARRAPERGSDRCRGGGAAGRVEPVVGHPEPVHLSALGELARTISSRRCTRRSARTCVGTSPATDR